MDIHRLLFYILLQMTNARWCPPPNRRRLWMSLLGGVFAVFWRKWLLAMVFLASGGLIAVAGPIGVGVVLDADGRAFTITAPGLSELRGGFSATVEVDGRRRVLSSVSGMVVGERESATEATPYGEAAVTMVVRRFEKEGLDLLFRLGQVPGVSGVTLQAGLRNRGTAGVKLIGLAALTMDEIGGLRPSGQPENWLVTGWDAPGLKITALNEIKTPLEVWEGGGFYRGDGSGFLFGPVGKPTAYVVGRFSALEKDRMTFSLSAEMSGVRVDAGETRWGQQVVLLMEKPVHAMGRWAEWVAKTH